jgi:hypothetical protein
MHAVGEVGGREALELLVAEPGVVFPVFRFLGRIGHGVPPDAYESKSAPRYPFDVVLN